MAFTPEREARYLEHMFQWQIRRLHRVVLFAPVLLLLFALLQALVWEAPALSVLANPVFLAGVAALAGLAAIMRRIERPIPFAWVGIATQTAFLLACALLTRPGHGLLALVLPVFLATPLVTAPLWARRQTALIATALAYVAGLVALWHSESGPLVWQAYGAQALAGFLVAIALHAAVDQARRGYFEAEEELAERARLDSLTSLLNRRHFLEMGEVVLLQPARPGQPLAACFLDLDHFKHVNDEFGHRVGDRLLAEAARRMLALDANRHLIGRVGGEEFALLLRGEDSASAERLSERLREEIAAIDIDGARVTASVGVAQWQPGESLSDLLHRADLALLEAKRQGRDRLVHWHSGLAPVAASRPHAAVSQGGLRS